MTVLLRPLINEKSMGLTKLGFFTFEIDKSANKKHVEKVVKEKFKVNVISVKIVNSKSKEKMQPSRKGYYRTSGMKKAIVQLKKGEKIALFEVAQQEEEVEVRTAEGERVANVKEKKGLLGRSKVKVERNVEEPVHPTEHMHTEQGGKTKGEK
jgi:large subunit ribosomal protein L23